MLVLCVIRRHLQSLGRMHKEEERLLGVVICRNDSGDTHREADIGEDQVDDGDGDCHFVLGRRRSFYSAFAPL